MPRGRECNNWEGQHAPLGLRGFKVFWADAGEWMLDAPVRQPNRGGWYWSREASGTGPYPTSHEAYLSAAYHAKDE